MTTEIYNECLRRGQFPKQWNRSVLLPTTKPEKEELHEAQKYPSISLINIGGKVLEKLRIDLFSNSLINNNQFVFRPQKSSDGKVFAQFHLKQRNYVVMIRLDVLRAFDAAWWPSILNNLRKLRCPSNRYNLTRSYFSDRVAIWHSNTYRIERTGLRSMPQGSRSGPGLWNVMYDALLNLEYSTHSK
jgi:hypothetical protein